MTHTGAVDKLAHANLDGAVLDVDHPQFDGARRVYNAVIERTPIAIVRAESTSDVQKVVDIARSCEVPLAVRGGGHSFAGLGTCDGGIVCDLSRLNAVVVDPAARTAEVGGGALLGDVDAAGAEYGLVTPAGVVSHTGVGGLTLGGGMGYLSRRFGLTIDNLLEAEIVTADGRVLRTSADEEPDLFWAIRGGGGNFGVVTKFRFRMHVLGPTLIRRSTYHAADIASTLNEYRDAAARAPRQLTSSFIATRTELSMRVIHTGSESGAASAVDQFEFGGGLPDGKTDMTFLELQRVSDELLPWGRRYYSKGGFLAALDDRVIDVIAESLLDMPPMDLEVYCLQLGGAVCDVDEQATAYSGRSAAFYWIAQGVWDDDKDDAVAVAWCRGTAERLGEFSMTANYVNEQADTGVAMEAYGATKYRRLAHLKWRYDPENLFRSTQNIEPIQP